MVECKASSACCRKHKEGGGAGLLNIHFDGPANNLPDPKLSATGDFESYKHNACVTLQVDGCTADLRTLRFYYQQRRACDVHVKADSVYVGGIIMRFCQQCSRSVIAC